MMNIGLGDHYTYEEIRTLVDVYLQKMVEASTVQTTHGEITGRLFSLTPGLELWVGKNEFRFSFTYGSEHQRTNECLLFSHQIEDRQKIIDILFKTPLENIPLFINDENNTVKKIAEWRLSIGR
jgi:hypothetical protein